MNRKRPNVLTVLLVVINLCACWYILTADTYRELALVIQAASIGLAIIVDGATRRSDQ